MEESPPWAPRARRYEICQALGVNPWRGTKVDAVEITFTDDQMCLIDINCVNDISLENLLALSDLFATDDIVLDVDLGHDAIAYEREAYGGHYRIQIRPGVRVPHVRRNVAKQARVALSVIEHPSNGVTKKQRLEAAHSRLRVIAHMMEKGELIQEAYDRPVGRCWSCASYSERTKECVSYGLSVASDFGCINFKSK